MKRIRRKLRFCLPLLLGFFGLAAESQAGTVTLTVDRTDDVIIGATACSDSTANDCSLRGAINTANSDGANDYIINLPSGTYTIALDGTEEDSNQTGDFDIYRNLTIAGSSTFETSAINANNLDRVFDIFSGSTVTFENLAIYGGLVRDRTFNRGGGINNDGTLTLNRVSVYQCEASRTNTGEAPRGGAIASTGTLIITNSTISSNTATGPDTGGNGGWGGAIYAEGNALIVDTIILGNTCGQGGVSSCKGGAIFSIGSTNLVRVAIYTNVANGWDAEPSYGAGIYVQNGTVIATNVTFSLNAAIGALSSGGGAFAGSLGRL